MAYQDPMETGGSKLKGLAVTAGVVVLGAMAVALGNGAFSSPPPPAKPTKIEAPAPPPKPAAAPSAESTPDAKAKPIKTRPHHKG